MGSVYQAEQEGAAERVAVKVINSSLLGPQSSGVQRFRREARAATAADSEHIVQVPFGVAETKEAKVTKLVEKPKLNYRINAGIYVLNPELIPTIPKGRMYPITELLNGCLKDGKRVGAYNMQEVWNDIGLPEEYQRAQGG